MASIRSLARCIGLTGNLSIIRDFFGYRHTPGPLSLLTQARRLEDLHIVHLNLIRVGIENFTEAHEIEIDTGVQFLRDLYANNAEIAVGRVERRWISVADAAGRDVINDDAEAKALTREWTVSNDGVDIFFVLTYAGTIGGLSDINGPCNKDSGTMNGCVVEMRFVDTGYVIAHELGHYLGLRHEDDDGNNLMFPTGITVGNINDDQAETMRWHCFVRARCGVPLWDARGGAG